MSLQYDEKWKQEKRQILTLMDCILPGELIPFRKGNEIDNEPDGILQLNEQTIGIELTKIHDQNESLKRDSELRKIQLYLGQYLNEHLLNLPMKLSVGFDGNEAPINAKGRKIFQEKAGEQLVDLLPKIINHPDLKNEFKTKIENVTFKIFAPNAQTLKIGVTFSLSTPRENLPLFEDAVLKGIELKTKIAYSTKVNWLLLHEMTTLASIVDCNFSLLFDEIKKIENLNFRAIYLLPNKMIASMGPHPRLYRLFPSLGVYY